MKGKQFKIKLKTFFSSNLTYVLLLALIPTFIIIFIKPIDFKKYKIKLNYTRLNYNAVYTYEDLDYDGKEEHISLYNVYKSPLGLLVYNSDMEHCGQYNSQYYMPIDNTANKIYCEDINNDSIKEIIYFSQTEDSLFLSIFSYNKLDFLVKERFISTIGLNDKKDYAYYWLTSSDINEDKNKEIYFSIIGGFALYPRKIFRYDFVNDSLISSLDVGAKQDVNPFYNKDGDLFFLSGSRATDNCNEAFPYEYLDTCTWFFAYDEELNFITRPKYFIGKPSSLTNIFLYKENYLGLLTNSGTYGSDSKILYFNEEGKIIDTAIMPKKFIQENLIKFNIGTKELFFISEMSHDKLRYYEFYPEKKKLKQTSLSKKLNGYLRPYIYDIDNDGEEEYFLLNNIDYTLSLYRNNLKNPVEIPVDNDFVHIIDISSKVTDDVIKLIITSKTKIYFLEYYNNPSYWFRYPFGLLIYIFFALFVWFVQLIPRRILKKQEELKNKIVNLQLKTTQNQLDPHFTFNALNVVASKIYKEDRHTAYDLFERFSRLMRSSLAFSDKVFRPINEELQFTEDYLEFQKTRFKTLFNFTISTDENINNDAVEIPKMLIQGFAENCVKHAFKGIDYTGEINIKLEYKHEEIVISIEDNGIGIKRSNIDNPEPESGYGIITTQEQIELINKLYNKDITIEINDKSANNTKLNGTLILIVL